jgi:hypothetical protein
MKFTFKSREISLRFDEDVSCSAGEESLRASCPAPSWPGGDARIRVIAEIYRAYGGIHARALVGGMFQAVPADRIDVRLQFSADVVQLGRQADCPSNLGSPLVSGLPADLSPAALRDLVRTLQAAEVPSGSLVIDRAAHNEESSEIAFRLVCEVMAAAVSAKIWDRDVESAMTGLLTSW